MLKNFKTNEKILIIGRTASGKTTFAEFLEEYGFISLESYTTRKPRYEGEKGHIFIDKDDVEKYKIDVIAETSINENEYFATKSQLEEADIYVIDPIGLYDLLSRDLGFKYNIVYVYADDQSRVIAARKRSNHDKLVLSDRDKSENNQFTKFENFLWREDNSNEDLLKKLGDKAQSIRVVSNSYTSYDNFKFNAAVLFSEINTRYLENN